ncbi:hypothetical protein KY327_02220 [Candidatus Woesearchaeota archaeon]|nr:hypothetical protein [Candidatus Woesearchaeota archaeon]
MAKPTPEQAMLMMVGAVALVGIISILTMTTTGSQTQATNPQDQITGHAIAQPENPGTCGMDVDCHGDQRCYCANGLNQYQNNDCTCQD